MRQHSVRGPGLRWIGPIVAQVVLLALLMAGAWIALPAGVAAQTAPSIVATTIDRGNFPRDLTFSALVENGESLEAAVLFYQVPPEGAITRRTAEITEGDVTRIEATAPTNAGQIYIPPGADIEWWWGLTGSDGETTETERSTFRYADPRYDWQVVEDELLQLYYYENENAAQALHVVGREAIARMGALLGVEPDFPARIYLWANSEDAIGVEQVQSDTFEQLIFTGGTRVLADLVHVFSPQPWIVAHELTHVLTKLAGESIAGLPAWLDEGTATYAEVDWRARRGLPLQAALEGDRVLSVRSIGSSTNSPGDVDLFYGQSADIVTVLIDEFGEEQFSELFRVFKDGTTVDAALLAVYGFDREGLDTFYRENRGLEAREATEDRSTQIEDAPIGAVGASQDAAQTARGDDPADAVDGAGTQADTEADSAAAQAEAEEAGTPRDASQVAARQEAVEAWNNTIRAGPVFGPGDGFPWEVVVTGAGGGALLASLVMLFVVLGRGPRTAAAPAGLASARWQPAPPAARPTAAMPPAPAGGSGGAGTETQAHSWYWESKEPTSEPEGGSAPESDAPDSAEHDGEASD